MLFQTPNCKHVNPSPPFLPHPWYQSILWLGMIVLTQSACVVNRYVAPPFTDVEKILNLKTGLTEAEVSAILLVPPHDVAHSIGDSSKVLIYNYRLKDRALTVSARNQKFMIHSKDAQREGEPWYDDEYREVFLLFKKDQLVGTFGERFFAEGEYLELISQRISAQAGSAANPTLVSREDLLFVEHVAHSRPRRKTSVEEDEANKIRRLFFAAIGTALASLIVTIAG